MKICFWGSRGSIPVSGENYAVYGGDTSCTEIRTGDELLIIDSGTGIRNLGQKLSRGSSCRMHLLLTHAHLDHLMGFPFFNPVYSRKTRLDIYGNFGRGRTVKSALSKVMSPPFSPELFDSLKATLTFHHVTEKGFDISSVHVSPIRLNHPGGGWGYRITQGSKSIIFLTDNELGMVYGGGHPFETYAAFAQKADLLIHDAMLTAGEYKTMKSWGHSSVEDALRLALEARVKRLALFHHHQDRTDREIDDMVSKCRDRISRLGSPLLCFAVSSGMEIVI